MTAPDLPSNDRRTVPRHLRDTEHEPHSVENGMGSRVSDAPRVMSRAGVVATAVIGIAAAAIGLIVAMRQPGAWIYAMPLLVLAAACGVRTWLGLRRLP